MDELNQLKDFITNFFKKIGAKVESNEILLKVTNVPENFEKFYGKKAPYSLVFEEKNNSGETELISKGSHLVKIINELLEDKAQTSLLRIEPSFDPVEKISSKFPLKNCKIKRIDSKTENRFFSRFSFLTVFQYLNEREQLINHIYVRKGEVFSFNQEKFKLIDGKKQDLKFDNIERLYDIAKNKLSELISPKTTEISSSLKKTLNREIERIEGHFNSQVKEYSEQIEILTKQVQELNLKIDNTFGEELEKLKKKLEKANFTLNQLEHSEEVEKAKKDKEFLINDEKQKHTLNVKTKLLNTSIIYYPFYHFNVYFDTDSGLKMIQITYDYLDDEFFNIKCGSCGNNVNEIIICSSGHLVCRVCGEKCSNCGKISCNECLKIKCAECGRKICSSCATTCSSCKKIKCKEHTIKDSASGKIFCSSCIKKCSECGNFFDPINLKRDSQGRYYCLKCRSKTITKETLKNIFN